MRDFSWKYFTMTGDVDSYLLYRNLNEQQEGEAEGMLEVEDDDDLSRAEQ